MNYDKNETLELLDKLTVTYGALEHTLGRQRTEKIFRENPEMFPSELVAQVCKARVA